MTAQDIKKLLEKRHEEDIFVEELGAYIENVNVRIDGWAMKRGTNMTIGYEIKVDRKDFENDQKWHLYKEMCNELYFVCPWGLIAVEDLPQDVGLIWVAKTGGRLYSKKKAVRKNSDPILEYKLVKSILWNRCEISKKEVYRRSQKEYWERWNETREINRGFGRRMSKTIRQEIQKQILDKEEENHNLFLEMNRLRAFKDELHKLSGCSPEATAQQLIYSCKSVMAKRTSDERLRKVKGLVDSLRILLEEV